MKHYLMSALFLSAIGAITGQTLDQVRCFRDFVNADDEMFLSVCPQDALFIVNGVSLLIHKYKTPNLQHVPTPLIIVL